MGVGFRISLGFCFSGFFKEFFFKGGVVRKGLFEFFHGFVKALGLQRGSSLGGS